MNAIDIIERCSSDLYIKIYEDYAYVISDYYLGDKEHDFGIYSSLPANDLFKGNVLVEDLVPDSYLDSYFNTDELHFQVDNPEVERILHETAYDEWDNKLEEFGFPEAREHYELCKHLRDEPVEPLSQYMIENYDFDIADEETEVLVAIENYIDTLDIETIEH